jgi:hypothetical protein
LIAGTGLVIVAIQVALRLVNLIPLLSWLTAEDAAEGQDQTVMEDVAYYVDRWLAPAPYNPQGNSFPRALTLYWFARHVGIPVQFRCGVMKLQGVWWALLA